MMLLLEGLWRRRRREELLPVRLRPLMLVVVLQREVLLLLALAQVLHPAKPLRIRVAGVGPDHGRRRSVEEERAGVLCKVRRANVELFCAPLLCVIRQSPRGTSFNFAARRWNDGVSDDVPNLGKCLRLRKSTLDGSAGRVFECMGGRGVSSPKGRRVAKAYSCAARVQPAVRVYVKCCNERGASGVADFRGITKEAFIHPPLPSSLFLQPYLLVFPPPGSPTAPFRRNS